MDYRWTTHLSDKEDKERFIKYVNNNRTILERLSDIAKNMELELDSKETAEDSYDSPSWAYKQADVNGYRRCLRHIQKLITPDQRNPNG